MSDIKVNTDDLRRNSSTLQNAASDLAASITKISAASASLDSSKYQGQFTGKVQGDTSQVQGSISQFQNRLQELGSELSTRATTFETANEVSSGEILGLSTQMNDFMSSSPVMSASANMRQLNTGKASSIWALGGSIMGGVVGWLSTMPPTAWLTARDYLKKALNLAKLGFLFKYVRPGFSYPEQIILSGKAGLIKWATGESSYLRHIRSSELVGRMGEATLASGGMALLDLGIESGLDFQDHPEADTAKKAIIVSVNAQMAALKAGGAVIGGLIGGPVGFVAGALVSDWVVDFAFKEPVTTSLPAIGSAVGSQIMPIYGSELGKQLMTKTAHWVTNANGKPVSLKDLMIEGEYDLSTKAGDAIGGKLYDLNPDFWIRNN